MNNFNPYQGTQYPPNQTNQPYNMRPTVLPPNTDYFYPVHPQSPPQFINQMPSHYDDRRTPERPQSRPVEKIQYMFKLVEEDIPPDEGHSGCNDDQITIKSYASSTGSNRGQKKAMRKKKKEEGKKREEEVKKEQRKAEKTKSMKPQQKKSTRKASRGSENEGGREQKEEKRGRSRSRRPTTDTRYNTEKSTDNEKCEREGRVRQRGSHTYATSNSRSRSISPNHGGEGRKGYSQRGSSQKHSAKDYDDRRDERQYKKGKSPYKSPARIYDDEEYEQEGNSYDEEECGQEDDSYDEQYEQKDDRHVKGTQKNAAHGSRPKLRREGVKSHQGAVSSPPPKHASTSSRNKQATNSRAHSQRPRNNKVS